MLLCFLVFYISVQNGSKESGRGSDGLTDSFLSSSLVDYSEHTLVRNRR